MSNGRYILIGQLAPVGETAEAHIGRLPFPHNLGQLLEIEFLDEDETDPDRRRLLYVPVRVPS